MSGQGKLEDWGLVADFYGLGEWAEYRSERTGADSIVLGGIQDWANYGILDEADWGRRGGLGRTIESWTERTGADGADWSGRGGWGGWGGVADGAD